MMRNKSFLLILAAVAFMLCGMLVLILKKYSWTTLLALSETGLEIFQIDGFDFLIWMLPAMGLAIFIQLLLIKGGGLDVWLFPCVVFLSSIGIVMLARLKPALLVPQLRWLIIGMLVYLLVLKLAKQVIGLLKYQYILGVLCLLVLCLPLLFGTEIGGSRNWLVFGPFQVQPSEFGKIVLVFFLASYLAEHRTVLTLPHKRLLLLDLPPLRFIAPLLLIWGLAVMMFVIQRDLGSALLFFGIAILMTYAATANKSYVFIALSVFLLAAFVSYQAFGHVRVRFDIWLNPWADPGGEAYQVVQSLFAFAAGGVWGTGLSYGHPLFIPEVHTDFIFSAIAEELGLIGSLTVMMIYAVFFYQGIRIALTNKEDDRILLASGISVVFLLQAFIIMAGVTKFLPLTGITLPFISYGGSSMVSGFMLLGVLTALSARGYTDGKKQP